MPKKKEGKLLTLPSTAPIIKTKNFKELVDWTHDKFVKKLSYDSTTSQIKVVSKLPWDKEEIDETNGDTKSEDDICYLRSFAEHDILEIKRTISATQKIEFGSDSIIEAVLLTAKRNSVNPLERYLMSLPNDNTDYLDRWLIDFCGAYGPPEKLIREIGRKFIIGMVKRALFPGTKFDTMLILEGPQGIGKSQLCRILAGNEQYYSEELVNLRDSRSIIENYAGKMVIEVGELSSFTRSDQKILKQFITKTTDTARPAYGRLPITIGRTFSFIGTTNEEHYLIDETGSRRFWPIVTENINLEGMRDIIDHLLAEAVEIAIHFPEKIWFDWEDEKELNKYRASKLSIGNENLTGFFVQNYTDLLYYRDEDGLIPFDRIRTWVKESEDMQYVKVWDKDISLLLQKIGAEYTHTKTKRAWRLPEEVPEVLKF